MNGRKKAMNSNSNAANQRKSLEELKKLWSKSLRGKRSEIEL